MKAILNVTKHNVEMAIEKDEKTAMTWLEEQAEAMKM